MTEHKSSSSRSSFWQVGLPFLAAGLLTVGLGAGVVLGLNSAALSRTAEISTVLLVIPVLITSLIPLIVLGAAVYGTIRLISALPRLTGKILELLRKINTGVEKVTAAAVEPVIRPRAFLGGLRSAVRSPEPEEEVILLNADDISSKGGNRV